MIENICYVNIEFSMRVNFNLKTVGNKSQIWLTTTINTERARVFTKLTIEPQYWLKTTRTQVGERATKNENGTVLMECLDFCVSQNANFLLLSELSRLGRSTLQVLKSLEQLHESGVSVYIQNLGIHTLQPNGEVNPVASIMVTVLAEMANIERSNIVYRLNSGRDSYIKNGGKLGRKPGSVKTSEQKREEYKEVISLLKKGYAIRNVAKLSGVSTSTVQRIKKDFCI